MKTVLLYLLLHLILAVPVCAQGGKKVQAEIDSLIALAWQAKRENGNTAVALANTAIKKAVPVNYLKGLSESYNILGIVARDQGHLPKADTFFQKCLAIRHKLADSMGIASTYSNLGTLEKERGSMEKSFEYLFKAARICERNNWDSILVLCLDNISNTLEVEGDIKKAINYSLQSLAVHEKNLNRFSRKRDSLLLANAHYNLGTKYYRNEQYPEAIANIRIADELFSLTGDLESQVSCINVLAVIAYEKENFKEVETYFEVGIELLESMDDPGIGLFDLYLNYGVLELELGNPAKALGQLNKAKEILKTKGGLEDRWLLTGHLSEAFALLNMFDSAYTYQRHASVLSDSLFNIEKVASVAEAKTRFDTERKEKELIQAKLVSQTRTSQRNTLFLILIAAIIISALIYFVLRQRQRAAAKIAAQQALIQKQAIEDMLKNQELNAINAMLEGQDAERKRIAKDLHDRLGSMLTAIKWNFEGFTENTSGNSNNEELLATTGHMLDKAYEETRRIAHNMVSGVLTKFGLVPALKELCSSISKFDKLHCQVIAFGMDDRLDDQVEITIYRIVQELISNVLKHANASKVTVQISHVGNELSITVEDDGKGFAHDKEQLGMGLKNVEARVQNLNGSLYIDSGKGAGTSIIIEITA